MYAEQIGKGLFLIDLRTAGYPCLFSSYVLNGSKSVIIDPGPASSVSNLLSGLSELGMQLEDISYVALSHVHIDHSGCTGALLGSLPNAKVIVHPRGAPHLVSPEKLWSSSKAVLGHAAEVFGKPDPLSEDRIISTSDGQEFDLGRGVKFKAVETLGHAAHHLSFYEFSSGVLFPGDAAGVYFREFDVVVPTSPPPFYPNIALDSLEKLLSYNPEALCYMHFGKADKPESRLRNHVQQIRLWLRIAEEGVRRGDDGSSIREAIFAGDNAISEIASCLKSHPILRTTVYENSCDGFIEFARKSVN
jgi:glyoxylase-like metal-dependent hydrolase (beta-lactamase superfamily II)